MNRRTFVIQAAASVAAASSLTARAAAAPPKPAAKGRILRRTAKATLTPCVLNHGDTLQYKLPDGETWELTALATSYELIKDERPFKCKNAYAFTCEARINGRAVTLRREIGTQESFAEPYKQDSVHVWLDAVACIAKDNGGFLTEKDWKSGAVCMPSHRVRLVVHPADRPLCPEPLAMWYPNEAGRIDIRDCYNGEDVYLGPYQGDQAHSGLDINMKAGTVLSAPLSFDNHYLFHATAAGFNNNRWRGVKRWPDGSEWWLQSHHLIKMLVPERQALRRGTPYATTAGVHIGAHEHTHFVFRVLEEGGDYLLDPWMLFWEMFRQAKAE